MSDATPVRNTIVSGAETKTPQQAGDSAKKVHVKKFTTLSPYGRRGNIMAYRSSNLERTPVVYNPMRSATFDPSPSPQKRRNQMSHFQQPMFEDEASSAPVATQQQHYVNPYDWSAQYNMLHQSYHQAAAQFAGFMPPQHATYGAFQGGAHQQQSRHGNNSQPRSSAPSMGASAGNSASPTTPTLQVLPLQDLLNEYGKQLDYQQRCVEGGPAEVSDDLYRATLAEWATTQHGRMVLQGLLCHEPFECVDEGEEEEDGDQPPSQDPLNATQTLPCSINASSESEADAPAAASGTISSLQIAREILEHLAQNMEVACLDDCGCNVIRAVIEHALVGPEDMKIFLESINETLLINMCTLSQETRRVPQLLFEQHNNGPFATVLEPLVAQFASHAVYLSATQQGCIGYMRVYEACRPDQKAQMLHPLVNLFADLSCDPYGNYVVQCIVQHSEPHAAAQLILASFPTQCLRLSCNKYASNVMEKVIRKLSLNIPAVRRMVMDELVLGVAAPRSDNSGKQSIVSVVQQCVENCYANFVIQACIETSLNAAEFKRLSDRVRVVLPCSPYAAKIEAKLRTKSFSIGVPLPAVATAPQSTVQQPTPNLPARGALRAANVNTRPVGPVYATSNSAPQQQPMTALKDQTNTQQVSVVVGKDRSTVASTGAPRRPMQHQPLDNKENQQSNSNSNISTIKKGVPAELPKPEEVPTKFTPYNPSPFQNNGASKKPLGPSNGANRRQQQQQAPAQRMH